MSIDNSKFVPNVTFEQIPIKNLVSNQNYQRRLSESQILKAAEDFDLFQINPVKVSRRDGINYVFNGQHTIEIVALVSGSRDTPVWCMIYDSLIYEHEAQIFAEQQKHVRPLAPYETFVAQLEAGSDKHLMIWDLVQSYQLEISSKSCNGSICAVNALEQIYDKYGYHVLDRTLHLCVGTWEGEKYSLSANMLRGVAKLIVTFGDELNDDAFKDRLSQLSLKLLTRTAKDRHMGSIGYAEALVLSYNRKCKLKTKKLNIKKLYGDYSGDDGDLDDDENADGYASPFA